jgi:hypothetical protein
MSSTIASLSASNRKIALSFFNRFLMLTFIQEVSSIVCVYVCVLFYCRRRSILEVDINTTRDFSTISLLIYFPLLVVGIELIGQ